LIFSLSDCEQVIKYAYYIHPVNNEQQFRLPWSFGRVVLVGDSAHGMPPFSAQGGNQGLEDAAVISTCIAKIIDHNKLDDMRVIKETFTKYERYRQPLMAKIQKATRENYSWKEESWEEYGKMVYNRDFNRLMSEFAYL
jgi:2-polyprenyl-6-methoxyphenol hydroxylase-like FAD-dependent oxidoreductase